MHGSRNSILAIGLGILLSASVLHAEDSGQEWLKKIDASRMAIVSGEVRIFGKSQTWHDGKASEPEHEDFTIQFDYETGNCRVDKDPWGFLETPEYRYLRWQPIPGERVTTLTRYPLTKNPHPNVNPVDIRVLGFAQMGMGSRYSKYEKFRDMMLNKMRVVGAETGKQTKISFIRREAKDATSKDYILFVTHVDTEQGNTTTRIEAADFVVFDLEWNEINGIFVPVTYRESYNSDVGYKYEINWKLEWKSVNQPIPAKVFTYADLKRPGDETWVLYDEEPDVDGRPKVLDRLIQVQP